MMEREDVLAAVKGAVSRNGARLPYDEIDGDTVIARDAHIDGVDVDDFVRDLQNVFGPDVWLLPWGRFSDQRASFRGCGCLLLPFYLVWWLVTWPIRREFIPLPNGGREQLTVGHLADVLYEGNWFEPGERS